MWTAAATATSLFLVRSLGSVSNCGLRMQNAEHILMHFGYMCSPTKCLMFAMPVQASAVAFLVWQVSQWFNSIDADSHLEASQHFLEDPDSFEKAR